MKSSTTLALFLLLLCGSWMVAQDTNSSAGQTGSSGSSAGQSSGTNAGQNTAGSSNQSGSNTSSGGSASSRRGGANNSSRNLPKTATPIPLIGALGLGSFAAGIMARKRGRKIR